MRADYPTGSAGMMRKRRPREPLKVTTAPEVRPDPGTRVYLRAALN